MFYIYVPSHNYKKLEKILLDFKNILSKSIYKHGHTSHNTYCKEIFFEKLSFTK